MKAIISLDKYDLLKAWLGTAMQGQTCLVVDKNDIDRDIYADDKSLRENIAAKWRSLSCRCVDLADVHLVDYKNEISDYLVIPMEGNAARRICKSFPSSFAKMYVFTGAALVADNI